MVEEEVDVEVEVEVEEEVEVEVEEVEVEGVHYCDKVFELPDRTDESWARCRWSESLSPGSLTECEGGLECEGDCVPWTDWCSARPGSTTEWRCGGLLSSPEVCSHSDFWSARPCGQPGQPAARCTGWWPGQCSSSGTVTQSGRKYLEIFQTENIFNF